ncbi:MAG: ATP-dependent Clp protease proteolytic subunit [Candidatus Cloacimonadota bacterium]|nr:MAG: ATP-dependent Clp protease proteolytic subunit [Candidatus Cloacimonadota bacterium]
MSEEKNKEEEKTDILGLTLKSRKIFLSEDVNSKSAKKIVDTLFLLEQDDPDKPIFLFINSPGGEVNSGLAIYDVMEFIKPTVYTIGCGMVASIAAIIYLQPEVKNRFSLAHSEYLLHQPLGGMQGTASEIEIHAAQIIKTKAELNQLISDKTGKSLEDVKKDTNRDFWLDAKEAKDYGMVDKIISSYSELPNL